MKINEIITGMYGTDRDARKSYGQSVSKDLTTEEFETYGSQIELALEKYTYGDEIYRGIQSLSDILLVDPTLVERRAANTANYVNLLVSTLPSWQKYPPRNKSLICSGSMYEAMSYGLNGIHVVLPLGNPKIGVVNSSDFWEGFKECSPTDINMYLKEIFETAKLLAHKNDQPEAYRSQFELSHLHELDLFDALKFIEEIQKLFPNVEDWPLKYYVRSIIKTYGFLSRPITQVIAELLDPDTNEFQLKTLSTYEKTKHEVWISSPCILIRPEILKEYL